MDTPISRRVPSMASVVGTTLCVGQVVHIIWIPRTIRARLYTHIYIYMYIYRYVYIFIHVHMHILPIFAHICAYEQTSVCCMSIDVVSSYVHRFQQRVSVERSFVPAC